MKPRYSIPDAADQLGLSRSKLYERIRTGAIAIVKDGRESFITRSEIERYASTSQPFAYGARSSGDMPLGTSEVCP